MPSYFMVEIAKSGNHTPADGKILGVAVLVAAYIPKVAGSCRKYRFWRRTPEGWIVGQQLVDPRFLVFINPGIPERKSS
jgi:hypothetical protein